MVHRLNIFTLILHNIFKILKSIWWTQTKTKTLIYETNLTNVGFANSARTMIWCPVFGFRFENIQ